MEPLETLIAAALAWFVLHALVAGPVRPLLAGRLGENGFRGLFALLSVAALTWLILAYQAAPLVSLWTPPPGAGALALVLMAAAFVLLVFSLSPANPTTPAADLLAQTGSLPVTGITRITRHPMLWAFSLWAIAHLLNTGDAASLLLFGTILATALNGMASIDRKLRRRLGPTWQSFATQTSRLPFAAILSGRTPLPLAEFSRQCLLLALALFVLTLWLHQEVFGLRVI